MNKKKWIAAEIIDLRFENTESTMKQTESHDGSWINVDGNQWQKHS